LAIGMKTVYTYNLYHLGDCIIFLHLLRALAKQNPNTEFIHFCHGLDQLAEVVADIENIVLCDFENPLWGQHKHEAVATWKNAEDFWVNSTVRWDWSHFQIRHHKWIASRMGFFSPFTCREHLLFDYPAICPPCEIEHQAGFLIGDSAPSSGQYSEWADHSKAPMDELVKRLEAKAHIVIRTSDLKARGASISEIGKMSAIFKHHIMVPNGPFWPTMNTTNNHYREGRHRIVLLDNGEILNMPGITQMRSVAEVMAFAEEQKWL